MDDTDLPLPPVSEHIAVDKDGWCSVKDLAPETMLALGRIGHIENLSLAKVGVVTVRHARLLASVQSVGQLWIRRATRPAMRYLVRLTGLHELNVLSLETPGRLVDFDKARSLQVFRANDNLKAHEILNVCKCKTLRELGIQRAQLTTESIEALLSLPALERLDIEGTRFNDKMARMLARSATITGLDLGGTDITRAGLAHLVSMERLNALDLWATALTEDDLELLLRLPALEHLTLGNYSDLASYDPQRIMALLLALPKLKIVWLDGVDVDEKDRKILEKRLDSVRIM